MVLLGFDPGGINSFGWATLHLDEAGEFVSLTTGVASNAPDAVRNAGQSAASAPAGVGIDAPLFWVEKGDRRADSHVRNRVVAAGGHAGTVNSVNSLRGACLVQGILTTRLVAASWPSAIVTEAHPKALLRLWAEAGRFVTEHLPPICRTRRCACSSCSLGCCHCALTLVQSSSGRSCTVFPRWPRSVLLVSAMSKPNPAFEWDAAKARRPSTLRWAIYLE